MWKKCYVKLSFGLYFHPCALSGKAIIPRCQTQKCEAGSCFFEREKTLTKNKHEQTRLERERSNLDQKHRRYFSAMQSF